jgi:hypothetical protein
MIRALRVLANCHIPSCVNTYTFVCRLFNRCLESFGCLVMFLCSFHEVSLLQVRIRICGMFMALAYETDRHHIKCVNEVLVTSCLRSPQIEPMLTWFILDTVGVADILRVCSYLRVVVVSMTGRWGLVHNGGRLCSVAHAVSTRDRSLLTNKLGCSASMTPLDLIPGILLLYSATPPKVPKAVDSHSMRKCTSKWHSHNGVNLSPQHGQTIVLRELRFCTCLRCGSSRIYPIYVLRSS